MCKDKIIKLLDKSMGYIKKKYAYILAFLIIIFQIKTYFSISFYSSKILWLLLPFLIIFAEIWDNQKKTPLNRDSLLTFSGIILAILFFLFQDFQMAQNKMNTLSTITTHNCDIATINLQLKNKTDNFGLNSFLIDEYKDNYAFVVEKFGPKYIPSLQSNIQRMERANNLIRITQDNIDQNSRSADNKQIVDISKIILQEVCLNTRPAPTKFIDKVMSKLSNWMTNS